MVEGKQDVRENWMRRSFVAPVVGYEQQWRRRQTRRWDLVDKIRVSMLFADDRLMSLLSRSSSVRATNERFLMPDSIITVVCVCVCEAWDGIDVSVMQRLVFHFITYPLSAS